MNHAKSVERRCHSQYEAGCPVCQERSRAYYRKQATVTVPPRVERMCLCGCGEPVGVDFMSYASTECMFRGRQR